jgi:hypothetical protein
MFWCCQCQNAGPARRAEAARPKVGLSKVFLGKVSKLGRREVKSSVCDIRLAAASYTLP